MKDIRKNVLVSMNFNGTNVPTTPVNINVEFIPDVIILKGVSVFDTGSTDVSFTLRSSLIRDYLLCSLPTIVGVGADHQYYQLEYMFTGQTQIAGSYYFDAINSISGAASNITLTLSLMFEFIKYA